MDIQNKAIKLNMQSFEHEKILDAYSKLNICPFEITLYNMIQNFPCLGNEYDFKYVHKNKGDIQCIHALSVISVRFKHIYDATWISHTECIDDNIFIMKHLCDAYFDCCVRGGTYATIFYNDKYIKMNKNCDGCFIVSQFICTRDNPMFCNVGNQIIIYTDGNEVTYNRMFICRNKFNIFTILNV
jgi:hypothetical protein